MLRGNANKKDYLVFHLLLHALKGYQVVSLGDLGSGIKLLMIRIPSPPNLDGDYMMIPILKSKLYCRL